MDEDTEYIDEAMELLRGVPVVEFQPPSDTVVRDEDGQYHTTKTPAWVKFSTAFRPELRNIKGAALSVYVSIGLHVNQGGKAWPSVDTICQETGYARAAVVRAIKKLKHCKLIRAQRRSGTSTIYTPLHVAYGRASTPHQNGTRSGTKSELGLGIKSELKEEQEKKNKGVAPRAVGAGARPAHPHGYDFIETDQVLDKYK